jgi:hypothetical protein
MYTLINKTMGCRIAVQDLADRVEVTAALRGMLVAPIVKLSCKPMTTKYGIKQRPHFEIIDWRSFGPSSPTAPVEPPPSPPQLGTLVKPVSAGEEMNDQIPF